VDKKQHVSFALHPPRCIFARLAARS
jgi:hypothetical protein